MEILVAPASPLKNGRDGGDHVLEEKPEAEDELSASLLSPYCCFCSAIYRVRDTLATHWRSLEMVVCAVLLLAYLGYFGYSMYYSFGDEPSWRLLAGTIIGLFIIAKRFIKFPGASFLKRHLNKDSRRWFVLRKGIQWSLYLLSVGGAVTIVVLEVVMKRPRNLICLAGIAFLILACCVMSKQPDKINWHAVFWGMGLQFWFAVLIGKTTFGSAAFQWLADRTEEFLRYADTGSRNVFGKKYLDHKIVFQVMPVTIFFNATISVLYYLGVVQVIFAEFGRFLSFCLGTSPIESVSAAANLFLSLVETPILVKPFVKDITQSELFAVMTGGFASIAGSLLYAFAAYGAPVKHILTASVMSAPAALAFAKLLYPDERKPTIKAKDAYTVDVGQYHSFMGALTTGAKDGMKVSVLVVLNLMVFTSGLEFLDKTVYWFSERAGLDFTLSKFVAYLFYPITYMMGFDPVDCLKAAYLLGLKILTMTLLSFMELGKLITNEETLKNYVSMYNQSWTHVGDDIFLEATNTTLVGGVISPRSGVQVVYMICGLSNLASIGITCGAYVAVAPSRAPDIFRMVSFAFLAGNLASFSTACMAGLLYTD
ncbi:solute carrier family 28 member 3-like [Babylonia areolata]|uniref:solute carrier family 28 member 3-like n=1 Tax=Babylonia areolata TaxID=304850 RepID=UPI003FD539EB